MANLGKTKKLSINLVGVTANYLNVALLDSLPKDELDYDDPNLEIQKLYGLEPLSIISNQNADALGIEVGKEFIVRADKGLHSRQWILKASKLVSRFPGMYIRNLPSIKQQEAVISIPLFMKLSGKINIREPVMHTALFKYRKYSPEAAKRVTEKLSSSIISNRFDYQIWSYHSFEEGVEANSMVLRLVFLSITILVMFLCFFSLSSAMSANIFEQSKEIAVLRSIGLTNKRIEHLYIYEAFVLVMSSSFSGAIIGFAVSSTMTAQRSIFTSTPFSFYFPWDIMITVVAIAMICAFLSSYLPSRGILKNSISQIARMG
eukprot:TRINITY_DN8837_c0_g1_i1.p1 TRINITY_DN8837_c0_g1~~TRINITY_DN8837_c0_g1_i1.p1  ORF type:complete len:318 (-),score=31.34 TRINITY_DN8837_c0_g1_i1:60-1013(-)